MVIVITTPEDIVAIEIALEHIGVMVVVEVKNLDVQILRKKKAEYIQNRSCRSVLSFISRWGKDELTRTELPPEALRQSE